MKKIYLIFSETDNGKHYAHVETIKPGENLKVLIDRYSLADVVHVCENAGQAHSLAEAWNQAYKNNGVYMLGGKIKMTRAEFENTSFEDLMEYAKENLNDVTDEETLKQFAIEKLENDDFNMALHIMNAIYNNPYNTEFYRYDYSMGTLETPTPITEHSDIEDLIIFDEKTL